MPTISSSQVPPPTSWDEFEDIALAAAKLRWGSTDFYRNGRQGQKQKGVDVWGRDGADPIGVQCKNTIDGISLATVEDEIANAESFEPKLKHLYIATTAKRDEALQEQVRKISGARAKTGKFKIDILFWKDIVQDLSKDSDVFFAHYPQFRKRDNARRKHDLALLDELTTLLSSSGFIAFVDQQNMAGNLFPLAALDPLLEFCSEWSKPEREFVTSELEALRKELLAQAKAYGKLVATETFPTHVVGWNAVPHDWEYEQPERFKQVVDALHQAAGEIVRLYGDVVRAGKAALIAGN